LRYLQTLQVIKKNRVLRVVPETQYKGIPFIVSPIQNEDGECRYRYNGYVWCNRQNSSVSIQRLPIRQKYISGESMEINFQPVIKGEFD